MKSFNKESRNAGKEIIVEQIVGLEIWNPEAYIQIKNDPIKPSWWRSSITAFIDAIAIVAILALQAIGWALFVYGIMNFR